MNAEYEKYSQLCNAAFNCGTLAYKMGNLKLMQKARDLHRKYRHKAEQALARAKRQSGDEKL